LIVAWAFEMTPEGLKRETAVDRTESVRHSTGRKLDFAIIGLLAVAVVYFAVDKFVLQAEPEQAELAAEQAPAAEPVEREKSIAVLLFDNLSGDVATQPFTNGIHDDILTQISKIRALKVIARTSMERLDPNLTIPEIGAKLGVATVLEGGVQRAGGHVRINVQLIDCKTEAHLWADTYDRELTATNIFAIQSEIAKTVAEALQAALSPEEQELLDTVPTENMAALEAYFRGKQRMAKRTSAALAEAVDDFNRAIELDPGFALAYVGLAHSHLLQVLYSGLPQDEMLEKAQGATDKALALDDRLAEAYTSLGGIEGARNDEAAEAAYQRALKLNPNYATAYHWYGLMLVGSLGRRDEGLELIKKAAKLDPRSPIILNNVGVGYSGVGRFDESLTWYRKSIEIDPDFASGYQSIGFHYWTAKGQLDEAVRWFRKAVSLDPGNPEYIAVLGSLFLDLGDLDRTEYWSERSIELAPESFEPNLAMELFHLYRGDLSVALEYGRRAFESGYRSGFGLYSFEPVRIHEMRAGRYVEARAAFGKIAPELLNEDSPKVGSKNYRAAIDLALILSKTGEQQRADWLLESSLQYIQRNPRLGLIGYWISDVQIYTLQGDKQKALSALRQAIDEGWRNSWWYFLKFDPILESLHDEPEFQAMVAEIEADMAAQLERVREMERNGELEPIPELAAE
jgi:TolB-like protein/Tfp pilus assembly protein PilF